MLQTICKNCEHVFQGNYCPDCGQKSKTQRLDWHFISDEIKYTFLHINGGLLYTAKQLLVRPGDMIREFIEGKRVKHYKPILMVFVLAGLTGVLMHYSSAEDLMLKMQNENPNPKSARSTAVMMNTMEWMSNHYALFSLFLIPFFSFASWLAFKKWGYNFIENSIILCFITAQNLTIGLLFFPLDYLLKGTTFSIFLQTLTAFTGFGFIAWSYLQFFKNRPAKSLALRMLLYLFYLILTILFVLVILVVVTVLLVKFYPELEFFKQFKKP